MINKGGLTPPFYIYIVAMCLYPKIIENRKYKANKKNGGNIPVMKDQRTKYVPVACGKCIECMKQKSRTWNIRLQEEIKYDHTGKFVTLTFSDEEYTKISAEVNLSGYDRDNEIATLAVRRFLERWRKKYKKSVKHWLITELGHTGTENIHLHGLLFTNQDPDIQNIWNYGYVYIGEYVNSRTINYVTKYVTKVDKDHEYYTPKVLTSKGIGKQYLSTINADKNKFKGLKTNELYKNKQGFNMNLPIYYRNLLYSEEEREQLWINKLDQNVRYICGEKIDISETDDVYYELLKYYQEKNKRLGYGDDTINWDKKRYENQRRNLNHKKRNKNN